MQLIAIAVGGALGAVLRYAVSGWTYDWLGTGFPWGTMAVNLIGALLIGFLWQLFEDVAISPVVRSLIFTGALGAFTTFSTFALESFNLLRDGEIGLSLLNVAASDVLGLALVFLGIVAGRYVVTLLR